MGSCSSAGACWLATPRPSGVQWHRHTLPSSTHWQASSSGPLARFLRSAAASTCWVGGRLGAAAVAGAGPELSPQGAEATAGAVGMARGPRQARLASAGLPHRREMAVATLTCGPKVQMSVGWAQAPETPDHPARSS